MNKNIFCVLFGADISMYPHAYMNVRLCNQQTTQWESSAGKKKDPPKDNQDIVSKPESHTKYQGAGFRTDQPCLKIETQVSTV
jgi:hypothetical protein